MTSQRKQALDAAGFRVGTVRELLGLSDAEMHVIEIRVCLARALRALRQKATMLRTSAMRAAERATCATGGR